MTLGTFTATADLDTDGRTTWRLSYVHPYGPETPYVFGDGMTFPELLGQLAYAVAAGNERYVLSAAIGNHACSACGCLLLLNTDTGRWYHRDGTEGLACADAAGDRERYAVLVSESVECSELIERSGKVAE